MLEKIAAVADFVDQKGDHKTANELTEIIKTAQLFDAIRALFDPSFAGGEGMDFLKRLTRGWKRGKFDRRLGLVFAINEEREETNRKIEKLSKPLKEFAEKVNAFYAKILSGAGTLNYSSLDFKEDLNNLKSDAAKVKNTIGGRELRKALDYRNKLNQQMLVAVDKIKGIDQGQKETLINLLRGEASFPGATKNELPLSTERQKAPMYGQNTTALLDWLKTLSISSAKIDRDFSTREGLSAAFKFVEKYKFSPAKVLEYFLDENHKELLQYGFDNFKKAFEHMMNSAEEAVKAEESGRTKPTPTQQAAAVVTPVAGKPEQPIEEIKPIELDKSPVSKPEFESKNPELVGPSEAEVAAVAEKAKAEAAIAAEKAAKEKERLAKERAEKREQARRILETQRAIRKYEEKKNKSRGKKNEPKEVVPATPETKADDSPPKLAASAADRLTREISRFGRMQHLKKFARNFDFFTSFNNEEECDDILEQIKDLKRRTRRAQLNYIRKSFK